MVISDYQGCSWLGDAALLGSIRREDTPLQRLRNALADKTAELEEVQVVQAQERGVIQARIQT